MAEAMGERLPFDGVARGGPARASGAKRFPLRTHVRQAAVQSAILLPLAKW